MRKIVSLLLSFGMIFTLAACGQSAASEKQAEIEMETETSESVSTEEQEADVSTKTLVVYFSCTGTTELVAEYITEILGADSYQIVPWHGQAPRIISTFLESYDFSGKTIVPFCTSHSSGVGSSADNLHSLCAESVEWRDGKRFESGVSKESVQKWIEEIGIE
ncbi:MAG: hypothetical protein HFI99_18905 [Lachnospiraceae bacterium]|nr:hypothetical protein [Lachnospiraceae bacterium]